MARVTTCADYHNPERAIRCFCKLACNFAEAPSKRSVDAKVPPSGLGATTGPKAHSTTGNSESPSSGVPLI